jgi:protein-tyrosine phosphatase
MKTPVYWIGGPWPGKLAIVPRPRGGDWLEDEVASWREAGIDVVVSSLTESEVRDFDLSRESEFAGAHGLEYLSFPVPDRGLPASFEDMEEIARKLEVELVQGKNVAVHCRQGIGRSSLLAACVLAVAGMNPTKAFERIQAARGSPVPDTAEQREWVVKFANRLGLAVGLHK